ncbi:MAG: tRNA lysidine(34) synthetase TilS [Paracoccaceae bacterium]
MSSARSMGGDTPDSLETRFATRMGALLGPDFPSDIALAVSGGGDSMAMLTLAHNWTRVWGVRLWVVTVDHGLRDGSAAEAAMVARTCAELGHPHATLRWHWDGVGNLQSEARTARLRLIDRWRQGISVVLMAHTADDVAEGFLMRLARGSGVDGLSAMADDQSVRPHPCAGQLALADHEVTQTATPPMPTRLVAGVPAYSAGFRVVRPLLRETRDDLRHYLRVLQGEWVDDPSNADMRFDRVRMRRLLTDLSPHGLGTARLARTAQHQARAQVALEARAADVARKTLTPLLQTGEVLIDRTGLAEVEAETQLRLLSRALTWVAQAPYRPRLAPLEALLDRVLSGGGGTLHGCEARIYGDHLRVFREYAAVVGVTAQPGDWWDGRFRLGGVLPKGGYVRALGDDGWAARPADCAHIPYHAARSLPAVFDVTGFVGCPGLMPDFRVISEFTGKIPLFTRPMRT